MSNVGERERVRVEVKPGEEIYVCMYVFSKNTTMIIKTKTKRHINVWV